MIFIYSIYLIYNNLYIQDGREINLKIKDKSGNELFLLKNLNTFIIDDIVKLHDFENNYMISIRLKHIYLTKE